MVHEDAAEIIDVLKHYRIGELVDYRKDERGYCNINYGIETEIRGERRRYFLRRYKNWIKKEELVFEHSVIKHLVERKFDLIAKLIKTKSGESYVHQRESGEGEEGVFYAIFEFLSGEDRYTWVNPTCDDEELKSAARILAQFHNAVFDFIPEGKRSEPKIVDLMPHVSTNVVRCAQASRNTVFDAYLEENINLIQRNISQTMSSLSEPTCREMVQLVVHNDFHPGNLKFRGNQVIGLFDFDWSKIDSRCFDVALAIFYFFTSWEGKKDGELQIDQMALFLRTYQSVLMDHPRVGPLSDAELKCLPSMITASNLYVLNWTIVDYGTKPVDPNEYLVYLRHSVNTIKWFEDEDNRIKLGRLISTMES